LLERLKKRWAETIGERWGVDAEAVRSHFERPPRPELGEAALPCFRFARSLGRKAPELAREAAAALKGAECVAAAEVDGAYLNVRVDGAAFAREVIPRVLAEGGRYGGGPDAGKTVVIDFSSPNIAKPFGIGHLRSTVIGNALSNVYRFLGWRVVGVNYLGDWGAQVAKMMVAYDRWFDPAEYERRPIRYLYDLYVRFHQEEESNPELGEEAAERLRSLEAGEEETLDLWRRFVELSKAEFQHIYDALGVRFDVIAGESMCDEHGRPRGVQRMEETLRLLEERGVLAESEGAQVVFFDEADNLPPLVMRKSDGTTLYATREVTVALDRWRKWRFDRMLYVVGMPQKNHFAQVFRLFEMADLPFAGRCRHVEFGHYVGMSTRRGTMVLLEEILEELVRRAEEVVRTKNPELAAGGRAARVARAVAAGALVFNDLKNARVKDVEYDQERVLSFDGDTGPYLQYAHTRACGILRKWGREAPREFDASLLDSKEERRLVLLADGFPRAIRDAAEDCEPSYLAQHLLETASALNLFYQRRRVLGEDEKVTAARVALVAAVRHILANGLRLLGVEPLERM